MPPPVPRTSLIVEGNVTSSWVSRLSGLRPHLGSVVGLSLRNASRAVNQMRCGQAVDSLDSLKNTELLLLSIPFEQLEPWLERMLDSSIPWSKVAVVLCSARGDSGSLSPLEALGAFTGSLSEMEGFSGKRYLFEGHNTALHRVRRLVEHSSESRIVELKPRCRPVYEAGLSFASGMTFPMIAAAVDAMRAAGIHPKFAESAVESAVSAAVRAYLRAGRRGWSGPVARGDRSELRRQYQALFDVDEELAEMFLAIAVDYLADAATRPRAKLDLSGAAD
jgi:predicted short-subunit dehydrogenase-like oxidoreductase (DUF2520 family)